MNGLKIDCLILGSYSLALDALFPAGVDESRLFTFFRSGDVSTSVSTWSPPFFLLRRPPLPAERRLLQGDYIKLRYF